MFTTKTPRETSTPLSSTKTEWVPRIVDLFCEQAFHTGPQGTDARFKNEASSLIRSSGYVLSSGSPGQLLLTTLLARHATNGNVIIWTTMFSVPARDREIKDFGWHVHLTFKLTLKTVNPDIQSLLMWRFTVSGCLSLSCKLLFKFSKLCL